MVLKRLKLHQFFNGVARTVSYIQAPVLEGGQEFENVSKKGCCLSFEWYKPNFTTFAPPKTNFWKNPLVSPWIKSFRRPCTQAYESTPYL